VLPVRPWSPGCRTARLAASGSVPDESLLAALQRFELDGEREEVLPYGRPVQNSGEVGRETGLPGSFSLSPPILEVKPHIHERMPVCPDGAVE